MLSFGEASVGHSRRLRAWQGLQDGRGGGSPEGCGRAASGCRVWRPQGGTRAPCTSCQPCGAHGGCTCARYKAQEPQDRTCGHEAEGPVPCSPRCFQTEQAVGSSSSHTGKHESKTATTCNSKTRRKKTFLPVTDFTITLILLLTESKLKISSSSNLKKRSEIAFPPSPALTVPESGLARHFAQHSTWGVLWPDRPPACALGIHGAGAGLLVAAWRGG